MSQMRKEYYILFDFSRSVVYEFSYVRKVTVIINDFFDMLDYESFCNTVCVELLRPKLRIQGEIDMEHRLKTLYDEFHSIYNSRKENNLSIPRATTKDLDELLIDLTQYWKEWLHTNSELNDKYKLIAELL